jgi:hypothetical protein
MALIFTPHCRESPIPSSEDTRDGEPLSMADIARLFKAGRYRYPDESNTDSVIWRKKMGHNRLCKLLGIKYPIIQAPMN